jgi:transcriptional regulator GlxA family with amidase domain
MGALVGHLITRSHLNRNLSVKALAERACLSYRQFSASPAVYVEVVRLDEVRVLLQPLTQFNIIYIMRSWSVIPK